MTEYASNMRPMHPAARRMARLAPAAIAGLVALGTFASPAHATLLFSQDFSDGLGVDERVGGNFTVSDGAVGHGLGSDYLPNERSYYEVTFDLSNVETAFLSFSWNNISEFGWDGWNIQGTTGEYQPLSQPIDAIDPVYNGNYGFGRGFTGTGSGDSTIDISKYAGNQNVTIRFNFASDYLGQFSGVRFDNLALNGTLAGSSGAVPEPASWALMILGFGGVGAIVRRRRQPIAAAG